MINTIATVPIEQYAQAYEFKVADKQLSDLERLAQMVAEETYPARKAVLARELAARRNAEALGVEDISIPIRYNTIDKEYWIGQTTSTLYLGGIEQRLLFNRKHRDDRCASLYVGPLPAWVRTKYEEAKHYFPTDRLAVVSKHKLFFDIRDKPYIEPARLLSPLLLAFDKNDKVYLLAAWGLEYELPQSLGGKLPG